MKKHHQTHTWLKSKGFLYHFFGLGKYSSAHFDLSGRISVRNIPSVLAGIGWQAEEPHADAKIVVASMFWRIFLILQNKRCKYILAAVALLYARRERGPGGCVEGWGAESCSLKGWETYQIFSVGR